MEKRYGTFPAERLAFPFRRGSRKHSFFTNISKYLSLPAQITKYELFGVFEYRALGVSRSRKVVNRTILMTKNRLRVAFMPGKGVKVKVVKWC